jgi:hypothetical protein
LTLGFASFGVGGTLAVVGFFGFSMGFGHGDSLEKSMQGDSSSSARKIL